MMRIINVAPTSQARANLVRRVEADLIDIDDCGRPIENALCYGLGSLIVTTLGRTGRGGVTGIEL